LVSSEEFISAANLPELSSHDCGAWIIPQARVTLSAEIFRAKSIRHKTAYKADNIARRWTAVTQRAANVGG
jgi:hypothetical protein